MRPFWLWRSTHSRTQWRIALDTPSNESTVSGTSDSSTGRRMGGSVSSPEKTVKKNVREREKERDRKKGNED